MEYNFAEDILVIREILGLTQSEFANLLNVEQVTISRNELGKTSPSKQLIEKVYNCAFENNIQLNRLKEMLWKEKMNPSHKLLFHGAKSDINGQLSITIGRSNNDFGQGFYSGETYEQAISFVSNYDNSSVYFLDFNNQTLKEKKYSVDQEWMMTIACYRGALNKYVDHPIIKEIVNESRNCDYIIAPIADNRMFQIIDSFIQGELTDEQCKHCLAATNLGYQYVFISEKAISQVNIIEKVYLCEKERKYYRGQKGDNIKLGEDKVKLARIKYRGKGKYIDEILL